LGGVIAAPLQDLVALFSRGPSQAWCPHRCAVDRSLSLVLRAAEAYHAAGAAGAERHNLDPYVVAAAAKALKLPHWVAVLLDVATKQVPSLRLRAVLDLGDCSTRGWELPTSADSALGQGPGYIYIYLEQVILWGMATLCNMYEPHQTVYRHVAGTDYFLNTSESPNSTYRLGELECTVLLGNPAAHYVCHLFKGNGDAADPADPYTDPARWRSRIAQAIRGQLESLHVEDGLFWLLTMNTRQSVNGVMDRLRGMDLKWRELAYLAYLRVSPKCQATAIPAPSPPQAARTRFVVHYLAAYNDANRVCLLKSLSTTCAKLIGPDRKVDARAYRDLLQGPFRTRS
jgi:hypothetical protein